MKANYNHGIGMIWWFDQGIHHNNCKQCRFSSGCTEKNKHNSDRCTKFKPKSFKKKKRSKK